MITVALTLAIMQTAPERTPPPPPPLHGGPVQRVCPIGGEKFTALESTHYSTYGQRPDGRPYSYWFMPLPIPTCPGNGLVLFDDFDAATIAKLEPLIASPEYRRMAAEDSTYYRAQWLATRIGWPEQKALGMFIPAIWQVKPEIGLTGQAMPSPEKARAYQQEFVSRVRALPEAPADINYVGLFARGANAARELGDFDRALAMLAKVTAWAKPGAEDGWHDFAVRLRKVAQRRDSSSEPLDAISEREAVRICAKVAPKTPFDRQFCETPAIKAKVAEWRRRTTPQPVANDKKALM